MSAPQFPSSSHAPGDQSLCARLLELWPRQETEFALLCLDPHGRIVGTSGAVEKVLGHAPDELTGQPMSVFFTDEDLQMRIDRHERDSALSAGFSEDDRWHVRRDGTRIWVDGTLTAIHDDGGRCIGFVKVMRDRTDVRSQIEALDNRAAALRQTLQRKDRELVTAAHELANPLGPLLQACHLLGQADAAQTQRLREVIGRQLETLRRLIGDLRAAADPLGRRPELSLGRFELQALLGEVVQACEPQAAAHGQTLELLVPQGAIRIEADPARLHQVVLNLITNAIKYTPAGGRVWVKASVEGRDAVIRVEDTGVGIAPDMLPRIFELFTQESDSRHLSEGGMGVGLAVVKALVDLHGGTVEVRSDGRGKGSHFTVRLPLERAAR